MEYKEFMGKCLKYVENVSNGIKDGKISVKCEAGEGPMRAIFAIKAIACSTPSSSTNGHDELIAILTLCGLIVRQTSGKKKTELSQYSDMFDSDLQVMSDPESFRRELTELMNGMEAILPSASGEMTPSRMKPVSDVVTMFLCQFGLDPFKSVEGGLKSVFIGGEITAVSSEDFGIDLESYPLEARAFIDGMTSQRTPKKEDALKACYELSDIGNCKTAGAAFSGKIGELVQIFGKRFNLDNFNGISDKRIATSKLIDAVSQRYDLGFLTIELYNAFTCVLSISKINGMKTDRAREMALAK